MGRDDYHILIQGDHYVSTHAPAWGATILCSISTCFIDGFNPRARMGRDLVFFIQVMVLVLFQPTRPHGARLNL